MEGENVPDDWRGGIQNDDGNVIDYKFGPLLKNGNKAFLYVKASKLFCTFNLDRF